MGKNRLCIEITRKCNLKCAHCLRGEPQNLSLSPNQLKKILYYIPDHVEILHLTGGEPLIDGGCHLLSILQVLVEHMQCDKFEIITNLTTDITSKFFESIDLLTKISVKGTVWYSDDDYHRQSRKDAGLSKQFHRNLRELRDTIHKVTRVRSRRHVNMCAPGKGIICAGRAKDLDIKGGYYYPQKKDLYITASGHLVYGGNSMSYEQIDKIITAHLGLVDAQCDHYFNREGK